jgi:hypothetical protein
VRPRAWPVCWEASGFRPAELAGRHLSFISTVGADADGGGRTLNLAKAMREAARIGDRTQLRKLFRAKDAYEIVHALHSILLDVINAERASGRLEPLELDDIHAMFLSEESHMQQRAWENGEPVPKVEPRKQRPAKRRAGA